MSNSLSFPIEKPVLAVVGPTAIGKTDLSLSLADKFHCEIISLDSMQVYRYMDIGTAKASIEERSLVPHYLIDIVDPDEVYDADKFVKDALAAIRTIHYKNKIPLLTGGTGLYLKTLTQGLFNSVGNFPEIRQRLKERLAEEGRSKLHKELVLYDCISANRIHVNDTQRLLRALEIYYATGKTWSDHINQQEKNNTQNRFSRILQIGLKSEREELYRRINARTAHMLQSGLREEVENLLAMGYSDKLNSMQSIGYRHMLHFLANQWTLKETESYLARDTRHYAKRQFTWFKKMNIEWFDRADIEGIFNRIARHLE